MKQRPGPHLALLIALAATLAACGGAPSAGRDGRLAPSGDGQLPGAISVRGPAESGANPTEPARSAATSAPSIDGPALISTTEAEELLEALDGLIDEIDASLAGDEAAATTMGE